MLHRPAEVTAISGRSKLENLTDPSGRKTGQRRKALAMHQGALQLKLSQSA
jgi:hypothetical protein